MKKIYTHTRSMVKKTVIKFSLFLVLSVFLSSEIYSQNTYTFTSAGASGKTGPTQTQLNTTYTNTNLMGLVTTTNGIQTFTLNGGPYRITTIGAQGGNTGSYTGGLGAKMQGDFTVAVNTVIKIIVGQQGENLISTNSGNNTGGGGGSYVWINGQTTPLVIAGGGGGAGYGYNGVNAVTTTSGTVGTANSLNNGTPGTNGNGANPGGGGWYTPGQDFNSGVGSSCNAKCSGNTSGITTGGACPTTAIVYNGCAGTDITGDGGFGGGSGGNGYCSSSFGAGGGGGYSGGVGQYGGNSVPAGGGGGGSFNAGANQVNTPTTGIGNGTVIVQELCPLGLTASGTNSLAPLICSGQSVTLTTNGINNYSWSTGNTTNSVIVVSPTITTTYSLSATTVSNCTGYRGITVLVSPGLPALTITNTPSSLCLGKSATLTAGGALTYSWTGGSPTVTNGVGFFPTATTVYTVTGQNGCGQSTATTTITITPLLVTASTSSGTVCQGGSVTLTAVSAVNGYTWNPNSLASNPVIISPMSNTIYTVTASDGTCVGTATVGVNTIQSPTITVISSASTVCEGGVATLTASGASTYTWGSPASNSSTISVTPTISTVYTVSGTNALNCTSVGSQIVLTKPSPTVMVSASKTIVCEGGSVTLTASGANSYNWVNGPATATSLVNPTAQTTYSVVGTGTNACTGNASITINTLPASVSVSAVSASICEGQTTTLTATGANTYVWSGIPSSHGAAMVTPSATTVYSVTASTTITGLSCPSTNTILITMFNNPTVAIVASKTVVCKTDASVTLTGTGAVTYTWSTNSVSLHINVHPQLTTVYNVTGTDANGCMNTGSISVKVNICNGITELSAIEKNLVIYPNPSTGEFNVSADSELNLKLVNELGQEIKVIRLTNENHFNVAVTGLANGVYFLIGQNTADKINQKIVVSK